MTKKVDLSEELEELTNEIDEQLIEAEIEELEAFDGGEPCFDDPDDLSEEPAGVMKKEASQMNMDEIEACILSCLLKDGFVPDSVNANVFRNPFHQAIFSAITFFSSKDENKKFDVDAVGLLLSNRQNNQKYKDTIIPKLANRFQNKDVHIDNYISLYKTELILEKIKEIANRLQESAGKGEIDYVKAAATELNNLELFEKQGYDRLIDALNVANFEIKEAIESDSEVSGVPTGIPTLDDTTGGLKNSDLIILAARPGQGKTATAINFAYNSGVTCGFISSEMPSSQLAMRLLSLDSGVDAQKLRNAKKLTKAELKLLKESSERLAKNKEVLITDKPNISIQEVKEITKEWKEKYDIKILFIDYIQRLTYKAPGFEKMPRHERIGMVALESKEIAREFNIPVVGLAQISRGAEKNDATGGKPMLSDLKDSGMIEQEADLVICPFRENTSGMDVNSETPMVIIILKNRHGPLGEIDVFWIPKNMKIIEVEDNYNTQQDNIEEEEIDEEVYY